MKTQIGSGLLSVIAASPESQSSMDERKCAGLECLTNDSAESSASTDEVAFRNLLQQLCDKDAEIKKLVAENASLLALKEENSRTIGALQEESKDREQCREDICQADSSNTAETAADNPACIREELQRANRKIEQLTVERNTMRDTNRHLLKSNIQLEDALHCSRSEAVRSTRIIADLETQLRVVMERQHRQQGGQAHGKGRSVKGAGWDQPLGALGQGLNSSCRAEKAELHEILREQADMHRKCGSLVGSDDDDDDSDEETLSLSASRALRFSRSSGSFRQRASSGLSAKQRQNSEGSLKPRSRRCECVDDSPRRPRCNSNLSADSHTSTIRSLSSLQREFQELQEAYEGKLLDKHLIKGSKQARGAGGSWWQGMVACVTMPFRARARGGSERRRKDDAGLGLLLGEDSG